MITSSDDIELLRESVHRFAQEVIAPQAESIDQTNTFPEALWPALGELGLLGITVPEQDGGAGLGYLAHLVAMEEISRASASVGLSFGAHSNLCVDNLARHATAEQKERYLPRLISGEHQGALAMSEPGAGSDVVGSMACKATCHGDSWVANGSKMWITNGPECDVAIVYMRTGSPEMGSRSITAFIIEDGMPGFHKAQKLDKLGMRGSNTCELVFENCEIPAHQVLGEVNQGVEIMMSGLNSERLVLSGGPIGIMRAALDVVLPYMRERRQFGRLLGEMGVMQDKVAQMYTALAASAGLAYQVADQYDQGHHSRVNTAACLLQASTSAVTVALEAIQALGGNGYTNDYPTGRLLRDAKLYDIGAGTNEIRRMLIGRELIGKPA